MIQINLLPSLKIEYLRKMRMRRLVVLLGLILSMASIFVVIMLFLVVNVVQRQHLSNLQGDIDALITQFKETDNIEKMITTQNQLEALETLHAEKPQMGRLFAFINASTPTNIVLGEVTVDNLQQTIVVTGGTDTIENVNRYIDALKFAQYTTPEDEDAESQQAFANVVLTSFGYDSESEEEAERSPFTITLSFDPGIFNSSNESLQFIIPPKTTTREKFPETPLFDTITDETALTDEVVQ